MFSKSFEGSDAKALFCISEQTHDACVRRTSQGHPDAEHSSLGLRDETRQGLDASMHCDPRGWLAMSPWWRIHPSSSDEGRIRGFSTCGSGPHLFAYGGCGRLLTYRQCFILKRNYNNYNCFKV